MSDEPARWQSLVDGLRRGDAKAAQEFWDQFGTLLEQLAQKNIVGGMRRRVGADDVAQSVCRTFLRRARIGEFQLPDSESLWHLLCAITLTKAREQTRFHLRKKRGLDREIQASALAGTNSGDFDHAAPGPTPAEAAEFDDQFQQLLASMEEEERQIVDLKLQDCTQQEIAQQLGCSERTVRRILKRVQQRLERMFDLGKSS